MSQLFTHLPLITYLMFLEQEIHRQIRHVLINIIPVF